MRKTSAVLVLIFMMMTTWAMPPAPTTAGTIKGYITIGNSVVVLPAKLQAGDRIVFTSTNGIQVFSQRVGDGFFRIDASKIHSGVYILTLRRNGERIAAVSVPIKTM